MAIDIDKVLKSALKTATGYEAYPMEKDKDKTVPCLVYKRVSSKSFVHSGGKVNLVRDRFQITCMANNYSVLRSMVGNTQGVLIGQYTDYLSSPTETIFEFKTEDGIYINNSDYFVFYKPSSVSSMK